MYSCKSDSLTGTLFGDFCLFLTYSKKPFVAAKNRGRPALRVQASSKQAVPVPHRGSIHSSS